MKKCYICNQDTLKKRQGKVRDNDKLDVLQCTNCGLITLSDFSHIQKGFYESSVMRKDDKEQKIDEILQVAEEDDERRFQYMKSRLYSYCGLLDRVKNVRLLDFGCGAGGFLIKLKKMVDNLYGIEPEYITRDYVLSQNIMTLKDLESYKKKNYDKVDYITMFHVLEHLENPKEVLIEMKSILKNKGKILIEVPNANDALLSLYNCEAFFNFTFWSPHLFTYNEESFEIMAKEIGYKLNRVDYIQRYPLSNHMYWIREGKPGGHKIYQFLNDEELNENYREALEKQKATDTVIVELENV